MKTAAADARKVAHDKKLQKQRLLQVLADKQDASLLNKSEEELQAMLDAL